MLCHNNKINFSFYSKTISCSTTTIIFTEAGVAKLLWETVNLKLIIYIGNRTNITEGKKGSETTGLPTDLHLVFSR
jgi:hypothetical protein